MLRRARNDDAEPGGEYLPCSFCPVAVPRRGAHAQPGKGKPVAAEKADAKGDKKPSKEVSADEDAGPVDRRPDDGGGAQGKRLFDAERWSEAALVLKRVVDGETGDDEGNKQIAQYHLAICLYRLQFYQASYALFSAVADKANHLKFNETLLWLAKLATQLPEPADIIERVGKYKNEQIARFNNPQQRDLYWQLNYLLGRYKYRNRNYEEAISLFEKVDKKSKYYVQAQFFTGISYVQLRKSVPAVKSFQKIVTSLDEGVEGVEDERRMRDLAYLSMARTYYSASVRLDDNNVPTIDASNRLSAAVKYWNRVDVASEYWLGRALRGVVGVLHGRRLPARARQHPHDRVALLPELVLPRGRHPQGRHLVHHLPVRRRHHDRRADEEEVRADQEGARGRSSTRFKGEGGEQKFFEFLKDVRAGKANLSPTIRPVVENALSDRQLLRNLEYVRVLDEEDGRFKKAPASFRNSPIGNDVTDALNLARDLAIRNAGNAREGALPAQPRRAQRAPPRRVEDPHRHHRGRAQQARPAGRERPAHRRRSRRRTASSSPTPSMSSGRSTASTGATSSGSTGRSSCRSAAVSDRRERDGRRHRRRPALQTSIGGSVSPVSRGLK